MDWEQTRETDIAASVVSTCRGCKVVPEHGVEVTLRKSWDNMVISSFSVATNPSTLQKIKGDPCAPDDCSDSGAWSGQSRHPGTQVTVQILTFSSASKIYKTQWLLFSKSGKKRRKKQCSKTTETNRSLFKWGFSAPRSCPSPAFLQHNKKKCSVMQELWKAGQKQSETNSLNITVMER